MPHNRVQVLRSTVHKCLKLTTLMSHTREDEDAGIYGPFRSSVPVSCLTDRQAQKKLSANLGEWHQHLCQTHPSPHDNFNVTK